MSALNKLVALLEPPEHPQCAQGEWSDVESTIGTALPTDYKSFVDTYGNVYLFHWLIINSPFPFDIQIWNARLARFDETITRLRENDVIDGGVPFPIFPSPGGLLPMGFTDSAQWVCWITKGKPDRWGIYFLDPGLYRGYTFKKKTFVDFLLDLVTLQSPLMDASAPREWCAERHIEAVPYSEEARRKVLRIPKQR